ncbi:MAG: hypothetical protein MUF00_18585 [Gemmatimonadaceae bacterium]|nr:hypothetical protein [Gemmatimonadaceae bacterium]
MHRALPIARGLVRGRRLAECVGIRGREARALGVEPSLELDCLGEMHTVEQRPTVDRGGLLDVAVGQQALELFDVSRDPLAVESQFVARTQDHVIAQGRAQDVQRVGEQRSGTICGGLRPECGRDLLTRDGPAARGGEHGEQRQPVSAGAATDDWSVRSVDRGRPQQSDRDQ